MIILSLLLVYLALLALLLAPVNYAAYLLSQGRSEEALRLFLWFHRLRRFLPNWKGPLALNIAACYINLGHTLEAMPYIETAIAELGRRNMTVHLALAKAYQGILLTRKGEFERAEQVFAELFASRLPPRFVPHIEQYAAGCYLNIGRFAEAEAALQRALEGVKPGSDLRVTAENNLAWCRYYQGSLTEALAIHRRIISQPTRVPWVQSYVLGDYLSLLAEAGEIEEAQKVEGRLLPILATLPDHAQAAVCRGTARLALRKDDLDKARDFAERASPLDLNPNGQAITLLIQAEVFAARRNTHRALTLCEEVQRLNCLDFYKQRAQALCDRLTLPLTSLKPLLDSPAVTQQTTG